MCDTVVVVRPSGVLFAKNSDRDPNEAQLLEWHARRHYAAGSELRCTWISIPQVRETHAVLLSRPFWMWGAEMGANEHGVTIGSEAVFTRTPVAATGLTGMDLLRLALERADTAKRAVEVITGLLETHGQGGGCGHEDRRFAYHNSYLVADPKAAFVLETAGRRWAVEEVRGGTRSISNALTIPGFAQEHSDFVKTRVSCARIRQGRTLALGRESQEVAHLARVLRDHGEGRNGPTYSLFTGGLDAPCMHAGGVVASSQTTASWLADLRPGRVRHWATGTAAPCTGLFKPVRVDQPLNLGPAPTDRVDELSLWWRHERLHRQVMTDPAELMPLFMEERDAVETRWFGAETDSAAAFAEADRLLDAWRRRLAGHSRRDLRPAWVRRYWRVRDARAGLETGSAGRKTSPVVER